MLLACGHVAADLSSSAVGEVLQLVDDVIAARVAPARWPRTSGEIPAFFERGNFGVSVRKDDPALVRG